MASIANKAEQQPVEPLKRQSSMTEVDELLKLAAMTPPVPASSRGQAKAVKEGKASKPMKAAKAKARAKAMKAGNTKVKQTKATKVATAKKAAKSSGDAKEVPPIQKKSSETVTPMKKAAGDDGTPVKALKMDKKNVHSRAYHCGMAEAKLAGLDDEQAKAAARSAAKEAVATFLKD
jgi:hypothetical protein